MLRTTLAGLLLCLPLARGDTEPARPRSAREALQPFNLLIGDWRGAGLPEGTREERQNGHWTEKMTWQWRFKGDDAWLAVRFDGGKHFSRGELHYEPASDRFRFDAETPDGRTETYSGGFSEKKLTLERSDDARKETARLTLSLLHSNRVLYRYEVRPEGKTFFSKLYQVGATKEGEPLAQEPRPEHECVVSGGTGTSTVTYNGKTYYVCCSGCREEFRANPEKYIAEFEKRRAEQKKKGDK